MTTETQYKCPTCSEEFASQAELQQHTATAHPDQGATPATDETAQPMNEAGDADNQPDEDAEEPADRTAPRV